MRSRALVKVFSLVRERGCMKTKYFSSIFVLQLVLLCTIAQTVLLGLTCLLLRVVILHTPQRSTCKLKLPSSVIWIPLQSSLIASFVFLIAQFKNSFLTLHPVAQFSILPSKHLPSKSMPGCFLQQCPQAHFSDFKLPTNAVSSSFPFPNCSPYLHLISFETEIFPLLTNLGWFCMLAESSCNSYIQDPQGITTVHLSTYLMFFALVLSYWILHIYFTPLSTQTLTSDKYFPSLYISNTMSNTLRPNSMLLLRCQVPNQTISTHQNSPLPSGRNDFTFFTSSGICCREGEMKLVYLSFLPQPPVNFLLCHLSLYFLNIPHT